MGLAFQRAEGNVSAQASVVDCQMGLDGQGWFCFHGRVLLPLQRQVLSRMVDLWKNWSKSAISQSR